MSENAPRNEQPDQDKPTTPQTPRPPKPRAVNHTPPSQRQGYVPGTAAGTGASKAAPANDPEKTIALPRGKPTPTPPPASKPTPVPAKEPVSILKPAAKPSVPQPKPSDSSTSRATSRSTSTNPPSARKPARPRKPTFSSKLARTFFIASVGVFVLFFGALLVGAGAYISIARQLPEVGELKARQSVFASTQIYDRNGALILELTDPTDAKAGRRTFVKFDQISAWMKQATIATEDPNFYRYNVGFDPIAIIRVVYYIFTERDVVSGGSTITQQVARNLLLSPEERTSRSPTRKLREIILANEMVRRYSRDEILEIYLNENYYANQAYGVEAAAQTYFGKHAKDLDLAEASLLAGIPQLPTRWDPVTNKKDTQSRQNVVLKQMLEAKFIQASDVLPALREIEAKEFKPSATNYSTVAPHFMQYVRDQLDAQFGSEGLFRKGLRVYTTLDMRIQTIAEEAVKTQIAALADKHVTNGSAVVMNPQTGEILAIVGSADFNNTAIDGQVDVALMLRQPGSSIKPFTYLAALQKGWTPATLYWDMAKGYENQYGQVYTPKNYDNAFHGPMLMREALARSMNIPAVDTLNYVGVQDFLTFTKKFGINFPDNPAYGLAITLGGADAKLIEMTGAYAVLANNGLRVPYTAISKVESADGTFVCDYMKTSDFRPQTSDGGIVCNVAQHEQVVAPELTYLITSMLSDNNARAASFGANSVLKLSRPAAVKTGTTNDYRDNLTLGYTPDMVVGVWVGNSDNSEMQGTTGVTGAAPIWAEIMEKASEGLPVKDFVRPPGIIEREVCAFGGHLPSPNCPKKARELFNTSQPPLPADELVEKQVEAKDPKLATLAPTPVPPPATNSEIIVSEPANGTVIGRGLFSIRGVVNPAGFQGYVVEYGQGDNPGEWKWISGPHLSAVVNDQLTQWSTDGLPAGRYTLRVTVQTSAGPMIGYTRFDVN